MRRPSFTAFVQAIGYGVVVAGLVAAALQLRSATDTPSPPSTLDPLATQLARCRRVSVAGTADPDCEAAWLANRRRFFAASPAAPLKE